MNTSGLGIRVGAGVLILVALTLIGVVGLRDHAAKVAAKGEQLETDVLRLQPGVTTLSEVRTFVERTERPNGYAGFDGPVCDESECLVSIGFDAFTRLWGHRQVAKALSLFGVHPADYSAMVDVADGRVRRTSFSVHYLVDGDRILFVSVVQVQRFGPVDLQNSSVSGAHPAVAFCETPYPIGDVPVGEYIATGLATDDTTQRVRLNLECVTSVRGCSNTTELFNVGNMLAAGVALRKKPSRCSFESFAWSGIWPRGTYPK